MKEKCWKKQVSKCKKKKKTIHDTYSQFATVC